MRLSRISAHHPIGPKIILPNHLFGYPAAPGITFTVRPFYVTLLPMGSKDKGRKEVKKAPKPKPKPEPGRKREGFTPAPPK